ncbi:MAG: DUF4294 domain-containing protein [Crocinitomicaceae bacterium]|nr:DUF4294 domain-containing protein [Crocinitomicaceae bacterium]
MLRIIILIVIANFSRLIYGQETASIEKQQQIIEMRVDKNFNRKYQNQLRLLKRTYPMALKAKSLIDDYEADLAELNKKRQKKKYGKEAHSELKDEFVFNIRDLYSSEGDLLMKLVYRETGMTVNQIIKKYRGGLQNSFYTGIAKLWGQNLNSTYDPTGDDWITEIVIQDIESGRISFNKEMKKMKKADYKESMAEYRQDKKDTKERLKTTKKKNKKSKKAKKK